MYKKHKIYFIVYVFSTSVLSLLTNISISESLMQNFTTFLSITFGFYMASLSVLYNANYTKKLYNEIDANKPTQRKIHTLKNYFENSAYWSLFSIGLLMICSMVAKVDNNILIINSYIEFIIINVVFVNFIFIFLLFKVFINGLIEESSNKG